MSMKRGFTLVEFLIVIGILSLSVGSILLILTTVVKGANQTNIIGEVKQNGQNVLDTLSGQIRNATDVYTYNQTVFGTVLPRIDGIEDYIWVWTSTGEKLTIICVDADATNNGRIMVYTSPASATTIPSSLSGFVPISNVDTKSGVNVDCSASKTFNLNTSANNKVVLIDFTVKQGIAAPSRVDFNASAQFKTAISLRTYQ